MKSMLIVAAVAMFLTLTAAKAGGDAAQGKAKAAMCAGCHGAEGNSPNPMWPNLAGQHASYLEKEIRDLKKGELRNDPTMAPMVGSLSEQDIQDIAAYFSSQIGKVGFAQAAASVVAKGQSIYRGGNVVEGVAACMSCHGPRGEGNPFSKYPALAGQHAEYTKKQLLAFQAGERQNDHYAMMRTVAKRMDNAEIEAVAHYISGLQ